MASKFSISEGFLNDVSKKAKKIEELSAKDNFKVEFIDINKIEKNKKNFYEIIEIDELAEDIRLNGLNHNLVVRKVSDGKYQLLSGERRYTALSKLVEQGEEKFSLVPCKVVNVNDTDAEIILIQANAQTRELTEMEKLEQVERLTKLYNLKKAKGEAIGTIREIVANDLNLSKTQVSRYDVINRRLIPELKELLEGGKLNIASASEFAYLTEDSQKELVDILENKIEIGKNEAIKLKKEIKILEEKKEQLIEEEKQKLNEEHKKALDKEREELISKEKEIEELKKQIADKDKIDNDKETKIKELQRKEQELLEKDKEIEKKERKLHEERNSIVEEIKRKADEDYKKQLEEIKLEKQKEQKEKEELKEQIKQSKKNDKIEQEKLKSILKLNTIDKDIKDYTRYVEGISNIDKDIKMELKKLLDDIKKIEGLIQNKIEKV